MTYCGIVIDKYSGTKMDGTSLMVDIGVAIIPSFWIENEEIPCFSRTDSWIKYFFNKMSWPGEKSADRLICKIC